MNRLLALAATSILALSAGLAHAQTSKPRSPDAITAELETLKVEPLTAELRKDEEAFAKWREQRTKSDERKAELAWELYKSDPSHKQAEALLNHRWNHLAHTDALDQVLKETSEVGKAHKGTPIGNLAAYMYADATGDKHGPDSRNFASAVEAYRAIEPDNARGAGLLMTMASAQKDNAAAKKIYQQVAELYSDSRQAKTAQGKIRQLDGVGKPFDLKFTDAISGKQIDMKDLKGKVVVVDFWATWCGPCVADMPHMKELYTQYRNKGVEFIGVSLDYPEDKDGLKNLKEFVKENNINWPQYYQGNHWASEFSVSWGINSIPALFVVDKNGNLANVKARGELETILPKLLGST